MKLKKVPLHPSIPNNRLSFIKDGLPEKFKLGKNSMSVIISNIATMYLLKETVFNNEDYDQLYWAQAKDNSIVVKSTKEFCYLLINSNRRYSEGIERLRKQSYEKDKLIRYYSLFVLADDILDEIFLTRRFELGRFYLDRISKNLFEHKDQGLKKDLSNYFERLGGSRAMNSLDYKLKFHASSSTKEEKSLIKNCFKYSFLQNSLSDIDLYLQAMDLFKKGKAINQNISVVKNKSEKIFDSYFEIKREKKKKRGRGI